MKEIAAVGLLIGIGALFLLDRDRRARTSSALWIPVLWLWIAGSRSVSEWLHMSPPAGSAEQALDGSPVDRLVLTILLTAGLAVLAARGNKTGRLLRGNGAILLFFFYCACSALWSDYPEVAFKRWTKAVGDVVMVMVILTERDPKAAVQRFLSGLAFLIVPLSILLVKYYPELGRYYSPWEGKQFFGGVTTNKNILGLICMICGAGSFWRITSAWRRVEGRREYRRLLAHAVTLAMAIWLLLKADSMTALCCFLLAAVFMTAASFPFVTRRPWTVHLLFVAVLCIACSALFLDAGADAVETLGRDPTLTGRTDIWRLVISLSGNPLLGTGFESFWLGKRLEKIWSIYWWKPNEAHNGYLEVFLNLGWIGVSLLAAVLVTGYRNAFRVFRRDPEDGRVRLAYLLVALVYALTEAGFRMMNPMWIFLLFAVMAPLRKPTEVNRAPHGSAPSVPETADAEPLPANAL